MDSLAYSIISFLITLGILVTVHEFGHFWVARILGVKVLRFSIGFGPIVWEKVGFKTGTAYAISALPLGGYVKMLDQDEGEVAESELPQAFNTQSLWVRSAIVVAGPLFNLLFAVFAFWLVLVIGDVSLRPIIGGVETHSSAELAGFKSGDEIVAVGNQATPTWDAVVLVLMTTAQSDNKSVSVEVVDTHKLQQTRSLASADIARFGGSSDILKKLGFSLTHAVIPPKIGKIVPAEPAAMAGLQSGDLILSADGQTINSWHEWVEYIRKRPNNHILVKVQRGAVVLDLDLQPRPYNDKGQVVGRIGASVAASVDLDTNRWVMVSMGPLQALIVAVQKTAQLCQLVFNELMRMLLGQGNLDTLGGPISIAQFAGDAASYGLNTFLKFLANISISLGVLNLLPIPVLDGGHLVFFLIEGIARRPLPASVKLQLQNAGAALLLLLTVFVSYVDVIRLFEQR